MGNRKGFTVVELIIVIVVIGILAIASILSYGYWNRQIADTQTKSDLTTAVSSMKAACAFGGDEGCPTALPANQAFSEGVEVAYITGDATSYCIEARSLEYDDVIYYFNSREGAIATLGTCLGGKLYDSKYTAFIYDLNLPNCSGTTVQLPVRSPSSAAGASINWGDGTVESLASANQSHTYSQKGVYTVLYEGPISEANTQYSPSTMRPCLSKVSQWARSVAPTRVSFMESTNITYVAKLPTSVTNISGIFRNAQQFNQPIGDWDITGVTSMGSAFQDATSFNQNIEDWDVSAVTSFDSLFRNAASFNQPLNNWDVSNVTSLRLTFTGASAFNQPLNNWDTSNVTTMHGTFGKEACPCSGATSFNQPLNNWDTSNVTNMSWMFNHASSFNQDISSWDTSKVTTMSQMFSFATNFNQPLNTWNVSSVTNLAAIFEDARAFNQPLDTWNTANVTSMAQAFQYATAFNRPLNTWNTANVTNMGRMFRGAGAFNQPLSSWNVSKVTAMNQMFQFNMIMNQNLTSWNPVLVTDVTNANKNSSFKDTNNSVWPVGSLPTFST